MHEKDVRFDREVSKATNSIRLYLPPQLNQMIERMKAKARDRDEPATYAVLEEIKRRLASTGFYK